MSLFEHRFKKLKNAPILQKYINFLINLPSHSLKTQKNGGLPHWEEPPFSLSNQNEDYSLQSILVMRT